MSLIRTRLSFERTMMSWVRTATALITFGFTLAKANEYLAEQGLRAPIRILGLRNFSVFTIAIGLLAIVIATVQQIRHTRTLHQLDRELPIHSVGLMVAVLFSLLGTAVLIEAMLLQY
jgi:putative membrane protein